MSMAVLISIRPKWCEKIADGEKTIEVRKTRPKLETPFKVYIYCTKAEERLAFILKDGDENYGEIYHGKTFFCKVEKCSVCDMWGKRQKVVGEFICDRVIDLFANSRFWLNEDDVRHTCLTADEIRTYANGANKLYGWHISDLKIYSRPKELNEFWFPPELYCEKERCGSCPYDQVADVNGEYGYDCEWKRPLKRAPQSWQYVEELK